MYSSLMGLGTIFILFLLIILLIISIVSLFSIFVTWKMFEKANKPGWAALIPIYNTIVLFEIIGYKWYYIFFFCLNFIPIIGNIAFIVFSIHYNIKLAKSFGQEIGFGIGLALVSVVFIAIIAFTKDIKYIGPTVNGDIDFDDLF